MAIAINIIPEFSDLASFVLINLGQWTYMDLSYNYAFMSVLYILAMFLVINIISGIQFRYLIFISILF